MARYWGGAWLALYFTGLATSLGRAYLPAAVLANCTMAVFAGMLLAGSLVHAGYEVSRWFVPLVNLYYSAADRFAR